MGFEQEGFLLGQHQLHLFLGEYGGVGLPDKHFDVRDPRLEIQNLGETDIIVTYENQKTPPLLWHILKVILVSAVIFFGSAFSIMAFNNDVGVTKLFGQIYELIMGKKTDGFSVLEVTYSIGLAIGILIFFNHFGKKRFTVDPTPMEIQMRLYENDIQTTLVENAARQKKELEVGK